METSQQHWSSLGERGSVVGMRILFAIYRVVGRRLLWVFLAPVVFYLYATGKPGRQASHNYLEKMPSVDTRSNVKRWWAGFHHFCAFADSAFDKLDAWLGKIKHEKINYIGSNEFGVLSESKQGAIFIGSHLGNLEVCRALSQGRYDTVINVLVFTSHAVKFNALLNSVNPNVSLNLIEVSELTPVLAIKLKEKVDAGEVLVIVGDRTSTTSSGRVSYAPFLGQPAPFAQGPFILASLLDCPVYWLFCLKGRNGYDVAFEKVTSQLVLPRRNRQKELQKIIEQFAQRLEHYAIKYPYQWFNFYDFWQKDELVSRGKTS